MHTVPQWGNAEVIIDFLVPPSPGEQVAFFLILSHFLPLHLRCTISLRFHFIPAALHCEGLS